MIPWSDDAVQVHVEAPGAPGERRAPSSATVAGPVGGDATRGACSTSAAVGGLARSRGTGAAARDGAGEHVVGLQFGAKWTEGTGFTENGVIVDGRLTKIGGELEWDYDWDDPMQPWRVVDPGGQLDVDARPALRQAHKARRDDARETHQVFGTWSGRL